MVYAVQMAMSAGIQEDISAFKHKTGICSPFFYSHYENYINFGNII